ncbi:MAG: tripartite tricarboxylate transporter substrate binding protein [Hyphomicrobiales bacterium]|nr:tripartite tricarboxylate transporter substrate binding protein [Hyphomicrobiales bacterium]
MLTPYSTRCIVAFIAALWVALAGAPLVQAQEFPSRPIKIIVGFGPGGLGDITARTVAQKMSESLGKPVVVENMPGAGGLTASAAAARAAPDGHTLLLVSGQNAANPSLFKSLPYDWATDFTTVSTMATFDFIIVVGKDSALKTVGDLIASAKRDPARFNAGTISVGSIQNLSAHLFASMAGISMTTVPFRTTGEIITALMADQVQVVFETTPGVIGQVQSGNLRALGVSSEQPPSFLPGVPTIAASGVPNFKFVSWNGLVMPAKTPREIVTRLGAEVGKALQASDVRERFAGLGMTARGSSPEELQHIYDADVVRWRTVIADAKISPQ